MGVLNLTPDSFSDGGRFGSPEEAVLAGQEMEAAGASVIDVGAVSTRPGAAPVDPADEWNRLEPVLAPLRKAVDLPLSLDTSSAEVLKKALKVGVDLVNDVTGLSGDPNMAQVVAESERPVILMHMRGTPATMQDDPRYEDAAREIREKLQRMAARAEECGVRSDRILVDPGIGFGKRLQDNLALLSSLPEFVDLPYPVVLGCSRKAFLGDVTGRGVSDRDHATTATTVLSALAGVDYLRVHHVAAAVDALAVVEAVSGSEAVLRPLH